MGNVKMNIESIVQSRHCMSCGGCEINCPIKAISIKYNSSEGLFVPVINKKLCVECGKCFKACPVNNQAKTAPLGEYKKIYLAHSLNKTVRYESTSGGVVNSLVRFLIETNTVDCVLMVNCDRRATTQTNYIWITKDNIKELERRARDFSSRYVSFPVLEGLKIVPQNAHKIAIVGTPCQIRALTHINPKWNFRNNLKLA